MNKKIITLLLCAAAAFPAAAQGWYDAYLFSQNEYGGTARSVGMGNALTAVGGDPGSLTFNPAGSSVAAYSQLVITPGLSFASSYAIGTQTKVDGKATVIGYGNGVNADYTRFKLPNLGLIFNMDTGRRHGLKRWSFGIVMNTTQDYTSRINAAGVNNYNSSAGSLASSADGFAPEDLNGTWDYVPDPAHCPAWTDMVAYRSYMINHVAGRDGTYMALTECMDEDGNFRIAGPLFQQYGSTRRGYKNDMLINLSANISDRFYLGANLGITSLNYRIEEFWFEKPENVADFPTLDFDDGTSARFQSLRMRRDYRADGSGMYLKAGAIWRPFGGLRLGAAIQTPTILSIEENYAYTGDVSLSGMYTGSVSSPEDEFRYRVVSPMRVNAGVAYTLGSVAILSADYELTRYGSMAFRSGYSDDPFETYTDPFPDANADIRTLMGDSHTLRLGFELKPAPGLAIRTGYNYATSGIRKEYVLNESTFNYEAVSLSPERKAALASSNVSFGLGFSSARSFYLDAALRFRFQPQDFLVPYYYYAAADGAPFYEKGVNVDILTPEISIKSVVTEALVTLGWRF